MDKGIQIEEKKMLYKFGTLIDIIRNLNLVRINRLTVGKL